MHANVELMLFIYVFGIETHDLMIGQCVLFLYVLFHEQTDISTMIMYVHVVMHIMK